VVKPSRPSLAAASASAAAAAAAAPDRRSLKVTKVVAAATQTTEFVTPLPPPYVLEKDHSKDPDREKVIETSRRLYFDIMGKAFGGGHPAVAFDTEDAGAVFGSKNGVDRDGLLDLIKTKGVRLDSNEILHFLKYRRVAGL